jgi:hypothetical protein
MLAALTTFVTQKDSDNKFGDRSSAAQSKTPLRTEASKEQFNRSKTTLQNKGSIQSSKQELPTSIAYEKYCVLKDKFLIEKKLKWDSGTYMNAKKFREARQLNTGLRRLKT